MINLKFIQHGWLNIKRIISPNYNQRPDNTDISLIVIHNISLPPDNFDNYKNAYIDKLFTNCLDPKSHPYFEKIYNVQVSSHFLIQRDGEMIQYVNVNDRAWHAGKSTFNGVENCNDYSVSIELEGSDNTRFTPEQYKNLVCLINFLKIAYPSIKYITGHSYIAPVRKTDPGPYFKWENLNQKIGDIVLLY